MLPTKLSKLKSDLQSQLYLSDDDKKALQVLKLVEADPSIQKMLQQSDFLQKSFSAANSICNCCGKPL